MKDRPNILVVDDENRNLRLMEAMLIPLGYDVALASSGREALQKVEERPPDVVLLDVMMPGMDGFEVAQRLKQNDETRLVPIVMVTALKDVDNRVKALDVGADDFLSKPVDKTELRARVRSLLKVKAYHEHMRDYQKELEAEVEERTEDVRVALERLMISSLDTIYRLSQAAEFKDPCTGAHTQRISHYAAAIARRMGLETQLVDDILYATPMHDVGKIGIPDHILRKPGALDPDEWRIMKRHTVIGGELLGDSDSASIKLAQSIAVTHHERWDGQGYPERLKGEDIPVAGRIVAIADVFDALCSKRPYKEPFPVEESFGIIQAGRGSQFDPRAVDAFLAVRDEILEIREVFADAEDKPEADEEIQPG